MSDALMFVLAVAAFAWGLSLASYRWVALQNSWPMGVWQAERPILPRLIGLAAGSMAPPSETAEISAMPPAARPIRRGRIGRSACQTPMGQEFWSTTQR